MKPLRTHLFHLSLEVFSISIFIYFLMYVDGLSVSFVFAIKLLLVVVSLLLFETIFFIIKLILKK